MESMRRWDRINEFAWIAGPIMLIVLAVRARGPSLREYAKREYDLQLKEGPNVNLFARLWRPVVPLGDWIRTFAFAAGLILIGSPIMVLATTIKALVWEGNPNPVTLPFLVFILYTQTFQPTWFGLLILRVAIQDFRLVHYGLSSRQTSLAN